MLTKTGANYNLHTLNLTFYLFYVIISMSKGKEGGWFQWASPGQCARVLVPRVTLQYYTLAIPPTLWYRCVGDTGNHTRGVANRALLLTLV